MPIFSLFFFSVKIRLETRFNNVLDRKETFLTIKTTFSSPKNGIFPNGLTHAFGQKYQIFPYLDLVKIRVEKMLNNVLEKKETVSYYIKKIFKVLKIAFFQRGSQTH